MLPMKLLDKSFASGIALYLTMESDLKLLSLQEQPLTANPFFPGA